MRTQELLMLLQLKCDYTLSQKELEEELNLNEVWYNEDLLDNFIIETRILALLKMINSDIVDLEKEYYIASKAITCDEIHLTLAKDNEQYVIVLDREQFINDELEFIFDELVKELGLD